MKNMKQVVICYWTDEPKKTWNRAVKSITARNYEHQIYELLVFESKKRMFPVRKLDTFCLICIGVILLMIGVIIRLTLYL